MLCMTFCNGLALPWMSLNILLVFKVYSSTKTQRWLTEEKMSLSVTNKSRTQRLSCEYSIINDILILFGWRLARDYAHFSFLLLSLNQFDLADMSLFENIIEEISQEVEKEKDNYELFQLLEVTGSQKLLIPLFDLLANGINYTGFFVVISNL